MKKSILVIGYLFVNSFLNAQTEILVNTIQDRAQREPTITIIDDQENIAIVWKSEDQASDSSESNIMINFFNSSLQSLASESLVNTNVSGVQLNPQIGSNEKGDFVVVWSSYHRNEPENFYDIKGRYYSNMSAISEEFTINSYLANSQTKPQVAMLEDGQFIVVWESWFQDGSDRGIYAQRYNSLGEKNGNEFQVNTSIQYSQAKPSVKYFYNGNFIILYESWNEEELGYNLYAKIYSENGDVIKEEFMINSYTDDYQWFGDISVAQDNTFDIVWCSWEQDGFDGGIYIQSYDENYFPISEELQVNSSSEYYQWLPKIIRITNDKKAIIWSSWNLDGSREGVYYKVLSKTNKQIALEKKMNNRTESFQWEPNIISLSNDDLIGVWSSWGELEKDYEVVAKKITPEFLVGMIDEGTYNHISGISTSEYLVHVIDSSKLTDHKYEISFNKLSNEILAFSVQDESTGEIKVSDYPMNFGNGAQYLSDEFDGIVVELIPNFDLDIDFEKTYFTNNSGTNISFITQKPVINPTIAPVDINLIWGSTDTLSDGSFVTPLDTALSPSNVKEVQLPFYVKTISSKEQLEIVVFENDQTKNNRWDPGENIVFLTPEEFRTSDFSTHAQLISNIENENIIWPNIGDTNFIATIKPLTVDDVYEFTTSKNNIILKITENELINSFRLNQNYPNPFNPTTTIEYSLPERKALKIYFVKLIVYDILGREVKQLINKKQLPGNYNVKFDASQLSTGIYLYNLQVDNKSLVRKMLLIK